MLINDNDGLFTCLFFSFYHVDVLHDFFVNQHSWLALDTN